MISYTVHYLEKSVSFLISWAKGMHVSECDKSWELNQLRFLIYKKQASSCRKKNRPSPKDFYFTAAPGSLQCWKHKNNLFNMVKFGGKVLLWTDHTWPSGLLSSQSIVLEGSGRLIVCSTINSQCTHPVFYSVLANFFIQCPRKHSSN